MCFLLFFLVTLLAIQGDPVNHYDMKSYDTVIGTHSAPHQFLRLPVDDPLIT